MLYLVICRSKTYPIPPEFIDAFIGTCEYCGKLQQQGKVKLFSPFASFNGGMTILDVDSHDDAMQVIAGTPLLPFAEMEVVPLVTDEVALATAKAMKEAMSQKRR